MDLRWATWGGLGIALVAAALVAWATVLGYMPGDARGATRKVWTQQTGGIAFVLALASLLPLGWFRWVLLAGAVLMLGLSIFYWLTVGR